MILCNGNDVEIQGSNIEVLSDLGMLITTFVGEGICSINEVLAICAFASKMDKDGIYNECVETAERYEKRVTRMEADE